jgi:hypothetical protein
MQDLCKYQIRTDGAIHYRFKRVQDCWADNGRRCWAMLPSWKKVSNKVKSDPTSSNISQHTQHSVQTTLSPLPPHTPSRPPHCSVLFLTNYKFICKCMWSLGWVDELGWMLLLSALSENVWRKFKRAACTWHFHFIRNLRFFWPWQQNSHLIVC